MTAKDAKNSPEVDFESSRSLAMSDRFAVFPT